jgi:hypothetical protein
MCIGTQLPKMTVLIKCAYIAAAAQTGDFHHAVKHETFVTQRSAFDCEVEVSAARIALPHIR